MAVSNSYGYSESEKDDLRSKTKLLEAEIESLKLKIGHYEDEICKLRTDSNATIEQLRSKIKELQAELKEK